MYIAYQPIIVNYKKNMKNKKKQKKIAYQPIIVNYLIFKYVIPTLLEK